MAIARRYIPDRDDVRDVLQDSFVSIFSSIREFDYRGEGTLKAWVAKIVVNRSLDWIREHERITMVAEVPEEIDDEGVPDVDEVPPDILDAMIGRLPAGCRMVLNLFVFDQLSHRQIAQRLDIQEASSASQFFHAKKLLKEMIREYLKSQRI